MCPIFEEIIRQLESHKYKISYPFGKCPSIEIMRNDKNYISIHIIEDSIILMNVHYTGPCAQSWIDFDVTSEIWYFADPAFDIAQVVEKVIELTV